MDIIKYLKKNNYQNKIQKNCLLIYFIFRDDKFILNRNEKNLQKNNDIFWNIKEYNTLYIFNNNKLLIKD